MKKADEDFLYTKACLEDNLEFYSQICFHFHQAVEKYLKAYIISKELSFRKIHDLTELLQICTKEDREFSRFKDEMAQLTPFYIKTRYPDFIIVINRTQAEKALKAAREVAKLVKSKLSL